MTILGRKHTIMVGILSETVGTQLWEIPGIEGWERQKARYRYFACYMAA